MGVFHFRDFDIDDCGCGMKICSDSVLLAAWFLEDYRDARRILDAGTGSGVLALLAARICPEAVVDAVEIDSGACKAAAANFEASPWNDRLKLHCGDIACFSSDIPCDIIISNPPYFTNGELSADEARRMARHQSSLTYTTLLSLPLAAGGHLGMVTPADAADDIIFQAEMLRRKPCRICRVVTAKGKAPSRILWDFCDTNTKCSETILELRDASGDYSTEYRNLVEKYYQKLSRR